MNLEELKKLREENFLSHKKKKREYYLKKKFESQARESKNKVIDYDTDLNDENFALTISNIAKKQKQHLDSRKDIILKKLQEYKDRKKEYYQENREKRLEYDKEYREKKKEELKEYRKEYYRKKKNLE